MNTGNTAGLNTYTRLEAHLHTLLITGLKIKAELCSSVCLSLPRYKHAPAPFPGLHAKRSALRQERRGPLGNGPPRERALSGTGPLGTRPLGNGPSRERALSELALSGTRPLRTRPLGNGPPRERALSGTRPLRNAPLSGTPPLGNAPLSGTCLFSGTRPLGNAPSPERPLSKRALSGTRPLGMQTREAALSQETPRTRRSLHLLTPCCVLSLQTSQPGCRRGALVQTPV